MSGLLSHSGLLLKASGPTYWTPLNLRGLITTLIYDWDSPITTATGLSQWNDRGPNAKHMAQSTAGNQPTVNVADINGKRTISFNGTSHHLNGLPADTFFSAMPTAYVFALHRKAAADGSAIDRPIWSTATNGAGAARFEFSAGFPGAANQISMAGRRADVDSISSQSSATARSATWVAASGLANYIQRTIDIGINGNLDVRGTGKFVASGYSTVTSSERSRMGSMCDAVPSLWFDGKIAALVVAYNAPSETEREQIMAYYMWATGLQANLPGGHKYAAAPPILGDGDPLWYRTGLYLKMQGANNGTILIDETNSKDALFYGGAKTVTATYPAITGANSSVAFNGTTDYISMQAGIGASISLVASTGSTVRVWVRSTNITKIGTICSKRPATGGATSYTINQSATGYVTMVAWNSANTVILNFSSSTPLVLNQWHEIQIVRPGAGTTWYMLLDGNVVGTQTQTGAMADNAEPLYIGREPTNPGTREWQGNMCGFQILAGSAEITAYTPRTTLYKDYS